MARFFFHAVSHKRVVLQGVKEEPHPLDGSRTCYYVEEGEKGTKTCSEESFFNFYCPQDKIPWFDPKKKEQTIEASAEEKLAEWPANHIREARARGEFVESQYDDDFLPNININGGDGESPH